MHIEVASPKLVSVITPSFNQGRFIEQTIKSVLSQNYPLIEYIVIDGGSRDETLSILKKYSGKLLWFSEPDNGQADAINKGFRMAKGDILCWLNSDDTYEPGSIAKAVGSFDKHPDVMMTYGEGNEIDEWGKLIKRFPATQPFDLWALVNVWDYILQPTTFFKKRIFDFINTLDSSLIWCMDWDLWIRIGSRFRVMYVNHVFANSRIYSDTKTGSGGFRRFSEIAAVMRKYSGKRYPIGYFIFFEDTLENVLLKNYPSLYSVFKRPLTRLRSAIDKKRTVCQGFYRDGWLGPRVFYMVPSLDNMSRLIWDLEFPLGPEIYPNRIDIMIDGSRVKNYEVEHSGPFRIDLTVDLFLQRPCEIELRFSRSFVPSGENRRMVCYLHDVRIE